MAIRKAEKGDIESVVSLGVLLWGDHGKEDLRREFSGLIASEDRKSTRLNSSHRQ